MRKGYLSVAYNDPSIPASSKHKITRFQDPSFGPEEDGRLQRIYGGKNSQAYLNQVLAEDGVATQKTFNPYIFNRCFVQLPAYEIFEYDGRKMKESQLNEDKLILPEIPAEAVQVDMSADLGFHPDPTVIGIWITDNSRSVLHCKIMLYNITYTRQAKFINTIAESLKVRNVSLDVGGPGQTVYLDLNNDAIYPGKSYNVLPVDFRMSLPVGATKQGEIIKENAKCHATTLIGKAFENKAILLPSQDLQLYDEVDSSTQYRTNRGTYTYVGIDHHLDMMRCFVLTKILSKEINPGAGGPLVGYADF
jgi:hypothetical protein